MTQHQPFTKPPIVEAVVDIDVEMRPGFVLVDAQDRLAAAFADGYPVTRTRQVETHEIHPQSGSVGEVRSRSALESLMFLQADEKQLLQARRRGFTFNRLAPYAGFNQYQAEIEHRWRQFRAVVDPLRVTAIRMRYINRIELPLVEGRVDLDQYLKIGPRAPIEDAFEFARFNSRSLMFEKRTGVQVGLSLASLPAVAGQLPLILDIETVLPEELESADLPNLADRLATLRVTRNRVFLASLGEKCLALFQ